MSKEACDKYIEMTKKLISMSDEWHDTEEGEAHLDEMDVVWSEMTDAEVSRSISELHEFVGDDEE